MKIALLCALTLLWGGAHSGAADPPAKEPWSFRPLQSPTLPQVKSAAWVQSRSDQFLLARLEAASLAPTPPAPARVLIRRLYFDLWGLPPTPEEADYWTAKLTRGPSRAVVSEIVENLLASPHYGERWGRYWLDLARYTDKTPDYLSSSSSAWLYRDWVVQALTADMPYDEFVTRQLAADLLPSAQPRDRHALGFLGLSPTYFKELLLPPEIIKTTVADEWEEHVDAVGRTFLGLTVACARCHDHKTDPITNEDYYGLAGVFASLRIAEVPAIDEQLWAPVAKARETVTKLEKERAELKKKKPAQRWQGLQLTVLGAQIDTLKNQTPYFRAPMANGVEDAALYVVSAGEGKGTRLDYRPGEARDLEVQKRGNPNQLGHLVKRRFVSAFPSKTGQPRELAQGSGRLDLARAILEDARPLTARVMVNRVWQHHFGRGLVGTPSEFGTLGDAPTHPELLDDLAARFIAHGWSLKWLHREILLSAAWQQDSRAPASERQDPENRLFSRMPRQRLDIEPWRDSILAATGSIDLRVGGPSESLASAKNRRRTLYGTVNRDELDPMLRINDFPEASAHSPMRQETSTPLQMLFALNSPFFQQQATAFAQRLCETGAEAPAERVRRAYAFLYQRPPTPRELELANRFLAGRAQDRAVWAEYAQTLLASNETLFLD